MPAMVYDRRITVSREIANTAPGLGGYSGLTAGNETTIASNLPASIQFDRMGSKPIPGLPSDAVSRGMWSVFLPYKSSKSVTINNRDFLTDDTGLRYQVTNSWKTPLGYQIKAEMLQA